MLNLASSHLLSLITSAAGAIDVVPSWVDYTNGASSGVPGGAPVAITGAATTTIVPAVGTANTTRNVKSVLIRNKAGTSNTITVQVNVGGTLYEIRKVTLGPGDVLLYDEGSALWEILKENAVTRAISTADQALPVALTLLTGSVLDASNLKVGTVLKWLITMSKTAAGVATQTFDVRFGTLGTTGDTARLSTGFATGTQTAAADVAEVELRAVIRSIGAAGVAHGQFELQHNLSATGFAATPNVIAHHTSAGFDMTPANLKASVCSTPGASAAVTVHQVIAERIEP